MKTLIALFCLAAVSVSAQLKLSSARLASFSDAPPAAAAGCTTVAVTNSTIWDGNNRDTSFYDYVAVQVTVTNAISICSLSMEGGTTAGTPTGTFTLELWTTNGASGGGSAPLAQVATTAATAVGSWNSGAYTTVALSANYSASANKTYFLILHFAHNGTNFLRWHEGSDAGPVQRGSQNGSSWDNIVNTGMRFYINGS